MKFWNRFLIIGLIALVIFGIGAIAASLCEDWYKVYWTGLAFGCIAYGVAKWLEQITDDSDPDGVTLSTSDHAMVARAVTKAQALLGKMLEECDVEDHKEPLVQEAKDVVEFLEFAEKALDTEDQNS